MQQWESVPLLIATASIAAIYFFDHVNHIQVTCPRSLGLRSGAGCEALKAEEAGRSGSRHDIMISNDGDDDFAVWRSTWLWSRWLPAGPEAVHSESLGFRWPRVLAGLGLESGPVLPPICNGQLALHGKFPSLLQPANQPLGDRLSILSIVVAYGPNSRSRPTSKPRGHVPLRLGDSSPRPATHRFSELAGTRQQQLSGIAVARAKRLATSSAVQVTIFSAPVRGARDQTLTLLPWADYSGKLSVFLAALAALVGASEKREARLFSAPSFHAATTGRFAIGR